MTTTRPLFAAALLALAMTLAACGSSKSTNSPGNTPATTSGSTATTTSSGGATTVCTIPQNSGGDHDADNSGGPSDGDGCDR